MSQINYPITNPNLKGYQKIDGIWFPTIWFDEPQCAKLIIQYWFSGCQVYQFDEGYLLRFAYSKAQYCEQLEGWPLINYNGRLCSMQVSDNENAIIPQGDIVLLMGNHITSLSYQHGQIINPAHWLKNEDYILLSTDDYPINTVTLDCVDLTQEAQDISTILDGKSPKTSDALFKYFKKQKNSHKKDNKQSNYYRNLPDKASSNEPEYSPFEGGKMLFAVIIIFLFIYKFVSSSAKYSSPSLIATSAQTENIITDFLKDTPTFALLLGGLAIAILISAIVKFILITLAKHAGRAKNRLSQITSEKNISMASLPEEQQTRSSFRQFKIKLIEVSSKIFSRKVSVNHQQREDSSIEHSPTGEPSLESRKPPQREQRWRQYFSLFSIMSKLHHLIRFRQQRYVDSMLKLFEQGNIDEALKYAIPINGNGVADNQLFGVPKPRNKLSLSEKVYGVGRTVAMAPALHQHLSNLYRQSFKTLDKQNRIEEAAFVLIELLNSLNEGLEYLQKHQRYQQALDIAIARDADSDLIVRLCCLTQQWEKAIMVAKRDNAFANTVMLLEKESSALANRLRLIWAETLAQQAEWLMAIEVIWPLKNYRYLADEWFNYAGKTANLSASALVKRLILQPESIYQYQAYIETLQTDSTCYQQRLAIARAILQNKQEIAKLRAILSPLINAIISDMMQYANDFNRWELFELINLHTDSTLKHDLPLKDIKLKSYQSLIDNKQPQNVYISQYGQRAIYDATPINSGDYLLALGEAGVIVVDKAGKQLQHYMIAAHSIVISHNLSQVLLLANRDGFYSVTKLDLLTGKDIAYGYLAIQHYLQNFDGINWTVVIDDNIKVLSVEQSLNIVWQIELAGYEILQSQSSKFSEKWLIKTTHEQYELWEYKLPSRRLISRTQIDSNDEHFLINNGQYTNYYCSYAPELKTIKLRPQWQDRYTVLSFNFNEEDFRNLSMKVLQELLILPIVKTNGNGCYIRIIDISNGSIKMTIDWSGNSRILLRIMENMVIFYDQQGRFVSVDINKNELINFEI